MSAWLALPVQELGSLEFLAIHDRSGGFLDHRRSTVGSIVKAASGPLSAKLLTETEPERIGNVGITRLFGS